MNLERLFKTQRKLDERIISGQYLDNTDLLDKKILSLQVELGELANELPEVFKFWSNKKNNYKRALEEYVDCLHFILSIGLELGANEHLEDDSSWSYMKETNITNLFRNLFVINWDVLDDEQWFEYFEGFEYFMTLGKELGLTWQQIEQAYFDKNKVNHQRQDDGY